MASDALTYLYLEAESKAAKLLGSKADLPKPDTAACKAVDAAFAIEDDFMENGKSVDDATQEFVNVFVKLKSESRKYNAAIQKADLGLDLKDPEQKKKADRVRKYFQSNFDNLNDAWDQSLDKLEAQLDKIKAEAKKMK